MAKTEVVNWMARRGSRRCLDLVKARFLPKELDFEKNDLLRCCESKGIGWMG